VTAPTTGRALAGHTRVSTQALTSAARIIAAEVFEVLPSEIRVVLNDEYGALALGLNLPLPISPLVHGRQAAVDPDGSVLARARDARTAVRERFVEVTGSHVSRIDVRVTGVVLRRRRMA